MTDHPMAAPVVDCPACAGLGMRAEPCPYRYPTTDPAGRDTVKASTPTSSNRPADPASDRPAAGCDRCDGTGIVTTSCFVCEGQGQGRAQLVVTLANTDTGQIASAALVPGGLAGLTSALPAAVPQPGRLLVDFPPGSRARFRHCDHPLVVDDAIGWTHFSGWLCPTGLSIADPDRFSITPEPAVTPGQPNSSGGMPG